MKHLFCSDLDQKWAFFCSKSEIETPETRGTPETLWAHDLLMPEIFFESPGILLCQYVKELAGKDNVSGDGRQDQNGMSRFWIHRFHGFRLLSRIMLILGNCHDRPEALFLGFRFLQAALRLRLRLLGVVHNTPSPTAGLVIAKEPSLCNQITHKPFISKILIRFSATKNFEEKTFPNHPSTP